MRNFDGMRNVDWNWTINRNGIRLLDDDSYWMRNRNLHRTLHFDRDVVRNWYWNVSINRYWFWHRYGHFDDVVQYVLRHTMPLSIAIAMPVAVTVAQA